MNLNYLNYFVKLAEMHHYTRAAEQLGISQPSLSHAIRQLEDELGVPLFEKVGRNTTLTRFGEEFLECSKRTLSVLDDGVTALQRSARGEGLVRLGFLRALGTEYIPKLAAEYMAANPDKNIRFTFHSGITKDLLDDLESQKYDLVFCSKPVAERHVIATPVTEQELVMIVPNGHPLAGRGSIDLADAASYPFIQYSVGSGLRDLIDALFNSIGERPNISYETEEDQVIAGLVAQGLGISIVPRMEILERLDLSVLTISSPPYKREFFMVSNESVFLPRAAYNFQRFVLDSLN